MVSLNTLQSVERPGPKRGPDREKVPPEGDEGPLEDPVEEPPPRGEPLVPPPDPEQSPVREPERPPPARTR